MSIIKERLAKLDEIKLLTGSHAPDSQMCAMEAVAWIAGEEWSDQPKCACPVLGAFMRSWNDSLNDEDRQKLKPYLPKLVGSKSSLEVENRRSWLALDWLARVQAVTWLRLAKLEDHAKAIEALDEIKDAASAKKAQPTLDAAWDAAWAAAGAAAGDAARDAAGAAAGAATCAAAGALRPTVEILQASAFDLLDRMLAV